MSGRVVRDQAPADRRLPARRGRTRRWRVWARQLEAKAREARDWLTLRRLSRLLDPNVPVSPIAPAGPILVGSSVGPTSVTVPTTPDPEATAEAPSETPTPSGTPLGEAIEALKALMDAESADPDVRRRVLDALLGYGPDVATDSEDVWHMLMLARFVCDDPADASRSGTGPRRSRPRSREEAQVLNLLAALGDSLRNVEGSMVVDRIDAERIEQLFRHSLDLDPNQYRNYARAAIHFRRSGQLNEAERCLRAGSGSTEATPKPRSGWRKSIRIRIA